MLRYIFLILLCFPIYAKVVPKENRQLILVIELTKNQGPDRKWFYSFVEGLGESNAREILSESYQSITLLKGEDATVKKLTETLSTMAEDKTVQAIDMIVHLHGSPRGLAFNDKSYDTKDVRDAIKGIKGLAPKLRALYSTACYGTTHNNDWTLSGFRVSSGAKGVNANAAYEYPVFLRQWRKGDTFQVALEKGDSKTERAFWDARARMFKLDGVNSEKELVGTGKTTLGEIED